MSANGRNGSIPGSNVNSTREAESRKTPSVQPRVKIQICLVIFIYPTGRRARSACASVPSSR